MQDMHEIEANIIAHHILSVVTSDTRHETRDMDIVIFLPCLGFGFNVQRTIVTRNTSNDEPQLAQRFYFISLLVPEW